MKILFFGDLVGRPGRRAVSAYLKQLPPEKRADVVIANGENVTHGFGLSEGHYQDLLASGVDIVTGGNHIWDRREIVQYMANAPQLLRPANMPASMPGTGAKVFDIRGHKIGVINLMGQVFMGNNTTPPWESLEQALPALKEKTPILFVDFHAEATAEKISLAHFASRLGVSAFVGTHTHVQTADDRILNDRMGYLTDAGFNGAYNSVIGMGVDGSLVRLKSLVPQRLEVADSDVVQVNAVQFTVDDTTGVCRGVERINTVINLANNLP